MASRQIISGVHVIAMGNANGFLIEAPDGLTLIDAGFPGKEATVLAAIQALGRSPEDLRHLILTHAHPDHIGSAAAIVRATGARLYAHALDQSLVETGGPFRPMQAAPGTLRRVLCRVLFDPAARTVPIKVDQTISDGEILPIAGGIEVFHVPGHCAGQVALLWLPGRMLFAADVFMNMMGLGDPIGFESLETGRASQKRLAGLHFDAIGFGHGAVIQRDAMAKLKEATA
ncbi:MAG: MBL fold metallo-hydrolase [Acidocella sp.]|nr:MBL fold metallo-hydrolase [Acidocella sp.]